jgi:ketosteroid isomerase-like protein
VSRERVEILLRGYDALNRGVSEALPQLSPDFVFVPPPILPESEVLRGPDGLLGFWRRWQELFDDFHVEVEEAIDAGDKVVIMAAVRGVGKDSGADVRTPSFPHVWTFEGDEIVRMEAMQNRAMAMEAVGLAGEDSESG